MEVSGGLESLVQKGKNISRIGGPKGCVQYKFSIYIHSAQDWRGRGPLFLRLCGSCMQAMPKNTLYILAHYTSLHTIHPCTLHTIV